MHEYLTDTEINNKLKELVVITDTREQRNENIIEWLDKKKIPHKERKLDTGDYSAMLGNLTLENDVIIERKRNLDEIAGNFTVDRQRFEDEWIRAKADHIAMHLVIENASWSDIVSHNYNSKLDPKSLMASLLSWQARYGVTISFVSPQVTPQLIYGILYYTAREKLKKGR